MTSNIHSSESSIRVFWFERSFCHLQNEYDELWRIFLIQDTLPTEDHGREVNPKLDAESGHEHLLPAQGCCVVSGKRPGG